MTATKGSNWKLVESLIFFSKLSVFTFELSRYHFQVFVMLKVKNSASVEGDHVTEIAHI